MHPIMAGIFLRIIPKGLTREEEEGFSKMLWAGFPDMRYDLKEMVARGDKVMVRFITGGTHSGEYQGLPPTGKKVEASGMWIGQVTDGKIVNAKEDFDVLGWMQQLGMELRPKERQEIEFGTSYEGGRNEQISLYRSFGPCVLFHNRLPRQGGNGGAGKV